MHNKNLASIARLSGMVKAKALPVLGMLCLLLLFVQSAGLIHSHDSDEEDQFECEICLKFGSVEDPLGTDQLNFNSEVDSQKFEVFVTVILFSSHPTHRARAPPSLA